MNQLTFSIGPTPATLRGPESGSVFLFVHSPGGNRRETAPFAELAVPLGWQVLAVDLPEHGGRRDGAPLVAAAAPGMKIGELQAVDAYLRTHWRRVSLRATSIGAWLSLQSLGAVENCLLCSPLLDMETMITGMMAAAGVTEERLQAEGEIPPPPAPPSPGTTFSGPGATPSVPSAGRPTSSTAPRTPWSPAPPWTASSGRILAASP